MNQAGQRIAPPRLGFHVQSKTAAINVNAILSLRVRDDRDSVNAIVASNSLDSSTTS
jgi:hypothetical protein